MPGGYLQGRLENVPGNETNNATLSTKTLFVPAIDVQPSLGVDHMERDDEIRNISDAIPVITEAYEPKWDSETRAYPDSLAFFLSILLGKPTSTAGNGVITDPDAVIVPTGAFKHVWTAPFGPTGASPQTASWNVAYADQGTFFVLKGAACESIDIDSPEKGGVRVKASGPALYMNRIANPSLSPAYESLSVRPFTRSGLTLPTWLASSGTHEDFSLSIAAAVETVRSLGIASKFPDVMEKAEGPVTVTGSIPQRQLDPDDWDALVNATGFAATAKWISETNITGAYKYSFWVGMNNCQYVGGDAESLKNQRRHGASFNWKASSSDGSTPSVTITLVNATASYN